MARILILDDLKIRHDRFISILHGHELVHAWTYDEAIDALVKKGPFDMACLDHDLGENLNVEPTVLYDMYHNVELDGSDLALWLFQNQWACPRKILIHSHNPAGSIFMFDILSKIPNIEVRKLPFAVAP